MVNWGYRTGRKTNGKHCTICYCCTVYTYYIYWAVATLPHAHMQRLNWQINIAARWNLSALNKISMRRRKRRGTPAPIFGCVQYVKATGSIYSKSNNPAATNTTQNMATYSHNLAWRPAKKIDKNNLFGNTCNKDINASGDRDREIERNRESSPCQGVGARNKLSESGPGSSAAPFRKVSCTAKVNSGEKTERNGGNYRFSIKLKIYFNYR